LSSVFTEEYRVFLELLISARKKAGLTQQALANRLNKHQSFISKYESGERRLDVIEFITIAHAIGINPSRFIIRLEKKISAKKY
jgi:transcriptional regulator with XRE-family HTH domain